MLVRTISPLELHHSGKLRRLWVLGQFDHSTIRELDAIALSQANSLNLDERFLFRHLVSYVFRPLGDGIIA